MKRSNLHLFNRCQMQMLASFLLTEFSVYFELRNLNECVCAVLLKWFIHVHSSPHWLKMTLNRIKIINKIVHLIRFVSSPENCQKATVDYCI